MTRDTPFSLPLTQWPTYVARSNLPHVYLATSFLAVSPHTKASTSQGPSEPPILHIARGSPAKLNPLVARSFLEICPCVGAGTIGPAVCLWTQPDTGSTSRRTRMARHSFFSTARSLAS